MQFKCQVLNSVPSTHLSLFFAAERNPQSLCNHIGNRCTEGPENIELGGGAIRHRRSSLRSVGDNSLLPNESNLLQFQPQGIILCITFRPYFNPHPSLQCTSPCQPIQKAEHYSQQRRRTAIYAITMQSEIPMQSRGQSLYERARGYRTSL